MKRETVHFFRIVNATGKRNWWGILSAYLVLPIGLFAPGIIVESAAMQWAAFALWVVFLILLLIAVASDKLTPEEAREEIDRIIRERDGGEA